MFDLQMLGFGQRGMSICDAIYTCDQRRIVIGGFILVSNVVLVAALVLDYFSERR